MSKADSIDKSDFSLQSRRDKIIQVILHELTFLNECFNRSNDVSIREIMKKGVQKLENLLKITGIDESEPLDPEFHHTMQFIYDTLHQVIEGITPGGGEE